jgi:hypothetical protein
MSQVAIDLKSVRLLAHNAVQREIVEERHSFTKEAAMAM